MGDPSTDSQHPLPELFTPAEWKRLSERLSLSPRQMEIARWICLGYTNPEIAARVGRAEETVGMHTRGLFEKLAIHRRVGVPVRLALAYREIRRLKKKPT